VTFRFGSHHLGYVAHPHAYRRSTPNGLLQILDDQLGVASQNLLNS
jgi:hypothetical protein